MSNTQTAYVIALAFDLLPEEKCKIALKYLYDDIYKRGWHLSTGFVGTTFILDALTKHGDIDTAYRLLLNERFPSWLYQVKHGATSLWERWNGWTEDKGYHTSGVNSFNHSWSGSVDEWLYKVIAGIRFDESETGFKHIIINPRPGGGIEHAYGEYISLYGSIISSWKIKNSGFQLTVKIPPNTRATIKIPSSKLEDCFANGQPISESSEVTNVVFDNNEVSCESGSGEFEFSSILM
jgi:alpha-L-rhamnosidase